VLLCREEINKQTLEKNNIAIANIGEVDQVLLKREFS
jgi:hypothetical protein